MKKKIIVAMSFLTALCSFLSCHAQSNKAFTSVSPAEFAAAIADSTTVLVDVRRADEFDEGHIPGALLIDVSQDTFLTSALQQLPKEAPIALYCRSGRRSKKAAELLAAEGYKVIELDGGWLAWQDYLQQ